MNTHNNTNGYDPLKHIIAIVLKVEREQGYIEGYNRGVEKYKALYLESVDEKVSLDAEIEHLKKQLRKQREEIMGGV